MRLCIFLIALFCLLVIPSTEALTVHKTYTRFVDDASNSGASANVDSSESSSSSAQDSADASSSSSSSSSDENKSTVFDDDEKMVETLSGKSDEEALVQVNWSKEVKKTGVCRETSKKRLQGMYRRGGKCRSCSQCGPDLYVRARCTRFTDTVCDWCLNPAAIFSLNSFRAKCSEVIQLQKEFQYLLEQPSTSSASQILVVKPVFSEYSEQNSASSYIRFPSWASTSTKSKSETPPYAQMALELILYMTPFALIVVVVYFIAQRKPAYRTVTVVEPPQLDETQSKQIIRAADNIRDKLGKKGYNRLEEFI